LNSIADLFTSTIEFLNRTTTLVERLTESLKDGKIPLFERDDVTLLIGRVQGLLEYLRESTEAVFRRGMVEERERFAYSPPSMGGGQCDIGKDGATVLGAPELDRYSLAYFEEKLQNVS
jgi:hypothetical protein